MAIPIFDLSAIFWATVLDVIIDVIIFKLFKINGATVIVSILLNFVIPYLSFWAFIQSRPPIEQQVSALGDFITNWIVNFVNFLISAVFGYIITAVIFIFSGGRTQKPEF
jgi:type II secretory pathway component PulF